MRRAQDWIALRAILYTHSFSAAGCKDSPYCHGDHCGCGNQPTCNINCADSAFIVCGDASCDPF